MIRYPACRDYGHAWAPYDVSSIDDIDGRPGYLRTLRCRNCATLRHQYLDYRGNLVSSSYSYAEGYLVRGGVGVDEKQATRLANVQKELRKGLRAVR